MSSPGTLGPRGTCSALEIALLLRLVEHDLGDLARHLQARLIIARPALVPGAVLAAEVVLGAPSGCAQHARDRVPVRVADDLGGGVGGDLFVRVLREKDQERAHLLTAVPIVLAQRVLGPAVEQGRLGGPAARRSGPFYPEDPPEGEEPQLRHEDDRAIVASIFELLRDIADELVGGLQVIVCDHVRLDEPWFEQAIVENWRDGRGLVPTGWDDDSSQLPDAPE